MSANRPQIREALAELHADVDRRAAELEALHAKRLRCGRGCASCCVDGLSVFEVEADGIREAHADLLRDGAPHSEGACAFLDGEGACRIYEERPYVCRTQGLPLRFFADSDAGTTVEYRDICPLNEEGPAIEELPPDACFTLGTFEGRLAALQRRASGDTRRVELRALFGRR